MQKPNIVFIFTDQQRSDTMGYAGDPVAITPHTDRLAAEGVVFPHCVTSSPVCMTTRASMMTGLQVYQHGVWAFANPGIRHGQSHVRNIRDAGYRTGVVGKTHLWVHGKGHTRDHLDEMSDWGFMDARECTGPVETASTGSTYLDHLEEKGLLDTHLGYLDTHLTGKHQQIAMPWELPPSNLPTEDHLDMYIAGLAESWLADHDSDQPFYLQVNFGGPHDPWDSTAEYRRMYNADEMPLSITEKSTGPVSQHIDLMLKGAPMKLGQMSEAENRVMKTYYYSKVTLIDDCVGRVIDALEGKGLLDNTWIIFSADHGEMLGDHGLMAKKVFYEGSVNVPCIFRPPGGAPEWQSQALVCHLDIVSSLIGIAGATPLETDGVSLVPLMTAGMEAPDAHTHQNHVLSMLGMPPEAFVMVRNERYKLSANSANRVPMDLYDLQEDPRELHNLVNDPGLSEVQESLLALLAPVFEKVSSG
ncbi:MAG: sulfatase-like hydrolase/transferase [Gammaproteobacteria bacterium]|nr:sulfatase-like hydrolase/transferase [Gammaproteobacteria bacterium]